MPDNDQKTKGLGELFDYPLLSAMRQRRTRRISQGTSLEAGELSHHSQNDPKPLSPLEEAVLIVCTGLTGPIMHDGPLVMPDGGEELGTPMLNAIGRTASSADNAQATSFFMINDEGIWLLRRPSDRQALDMFAELPPKWEDWKDADWLAAADAVKVKVHDGRLEFPRRFPYYLGWNKQMSNRPGTTVFLPVVDCTRAVINIMLILLSEPDGQRPLFLDDWSAFRPKDVMGGLAALASFLGLLPTEIAYQPVGGLKWARDDFLNNEINIPLGLGHAWRVDYEAYFLLQNLMLVGQGIGLGGWIHAAVPSPYVFQRDEQAGLLGLGFRTMEPEKNWKTYPPLPAPLPNPVGLDGLLEGVCPPYVDSMDEAVDRVLEDKYQKVMYGDQEVFAAPYNQTGHAEEFLRNAARFSPKAVEYVKVICNYIFDTYGRFPAHVDAFFTPGIWLQFHHLELEYYQKYYKPSQFERQARHAQAWDQLED
ncbi:MAG TPA: hypothetical protein VLU25_00085 [Acidobacteriota bacterium]|nr:hypothetical protein [Acidobacteriota bacterium]